MKKYPSFFRLALLAWATTTVVGQSSVVQAQDLISMTIEELLSLDITSVSKKKQSLSSSAAAVTVITEEDIIRSGARTIWDALRLAPGVHVGRIAGTQPAVAIRGLNDRYNSVLQVFIDGMNTLPNLQQ